MSLRCALAVGVLFGLVGPVGAAVITFDDLTLGQEYTVTEVFTSGGVPITVEPFQWSGGQWFSGGSAKVEGGKKADGGGLEININNVNLNFGFGMPMQGVSLMFGEYGGNINIEINGDFRNVGGFEFIDDTVIGGTEVFVVGPYWPAEATPGPGGGGVQPSPPEVIGPLGALFVTGQINTFKLGGQELWIDNVIACIPEPGTLGLLGLGVVCLLRRRGR